MALTRDQILGARDLRVERVVVPEWGGDLFVWELNGEELLAWERARASEGTADSSLFASRFLVYCLKDGDDPTTAKTVLAPEDVDRLRRKSPKVIGRLLEVAMRLNGMRKEDQEAAAGKSEGAPSSAPSGA